HWLCLPGRDELCSVSETITVSSGVTRPATQPLPLFPFYCYYSSSIPSFPAEKRSLRAWREAGHCGVQASATMVLVAVLRRCGHRAFYGQRCLSRAESHSRGQCQPARKQTKDAREGGETLMTSGGHFADRLCAAVERKGN